MSKGCGFFCWIARLLLIIGGLNWGLIGIFNYNVVTEFFGPMTMITRIIYIVVGLAAILAIFCLFKPCACPPRSEV